MPSFLHLLKNPEDAPTTSFGTKERSELPFKLPPPQICANTRIKTIDDSIKRSALCYAPNYVSASPNQGSYLETYENQYYCSPTYNYQQPSSVLVPPPRPETFWDQNSPLCPYAATGECRYGDNCLMLHGAKCEFCHLYLIHPLNKTKQEEHKKLCIENFETDLELAFAKAKEDDEKAAASQVFCSICFESILGSEENTDKRFGILPGCRHSFCLSCIRRWRKTNEVDKGASRSCPVCRTKSDFVIPSNLWVSDETEKRKLLLSYKEALKKKSCRYYDGGKGTCPFGNKCFYKHTVNGVNVDVGPPPRRTLGNISPLNRLTPQQAEIIYRLSAEFGGDPRLDDNGVAREPFDDGTAFEFLRELIDLGEGRFFRDFIRDFFNNPDNEYTESDFNLSLATHAPSLEQYYIHLDSSDDDSW